MTDAKQTATTTLKVADLIPNAIETGEHQNLVLPLKEALKAYMDREVLPQVPDAWVDHTKTRIGYEIPFTRHFYTYTPPRPLDVIEHEIRDLERDIKGMLEEVFM